MHECSSGDDTTPDCPRTAAHPRATCTHAARHLKAKLAREDYERRMRADAAERRMRVAAAAKAQEAAGEAHVREYIQPVPCRLPPHQLSPGGPQIARTDNHATVEITCR